MARRRFIAHRGKRKFKLKKQTLYSIFSMLLLGAAGLIFLSWGRQGQLLTKLYTLLYAQIGFGIYLLPFNLFFLGLLVLGSKTFLSKPNLSIGSILITGPIIVLGQGGEVGNLLWNEMTMLITSPGTSLIMILVMAIGFVVMLNTSLDKAVNIVAQAFGVILQVFKGSGESQKKDDKKGIFPNAKMPMQIKGGGQDTRRPMMPPAVNPQQTGPVIKQPPKIADALGKELVVNPPKTNGNTIWEYPPINLLENASTHKADRGDLKKSADIIEATLDSFGIQARVAEVNLGPAVTQYALDIAKGTKISKITALSNDLALALSAPTGQIRIEAPIPGRNLVGIEIPNRSLEFVTLKTMLQSDNMRLAKSKLTVALGLDVSGNPLTSNIAKMPHVLIAGTTGSGKSVLVNSWICSLLYRATPEEVKIILIDPKRVELVGYNGIPHLLTPVIVEVDKILSALKWAVGEMERRYKLFAEIGVRNIDSFNEASGFQALPYIVILVDELADLMMFAPIEVEEAICRIAQMARATGIHLVIATQRPSVNVITGLIKANIPCRIAFNVTSMIDSRVIIDMPGAEKLLGRGDMLYIPPEQAKPTRIQGTYVSEKEVEKLVTFLKQKNAPVEYTKEVTSIPVSAWRKSSGGTTGIDGKDALFENAVRTVCQYDKASASLLQRRLSVGYARAARILDQMEQAGIVGAGDGAKPRDVLVRNPDEYFAQMNAPAQTTESTNTS